MSKVANLVNKLSTLPGVIITYGTPRLQTFLYYAKTELTPPSPTELPEIKNRVGNIIRRWKTGSWRELTIKEAFLNTLVTAEVVCWFFVGECVGKRHVIGYDLS